MLVTILFFQLFDHVLDSSRYFVFLLLKHLIKVFRELGGDVLGSSIFNGP